MIDRHRTAAAVLASALLLSACGGDSASTGPSTEHGGGHSRSDSRTGSAEGSAADISFLTGMTPHHEQAVEMSDIVLAANPPAEVAALARQIKNAQDPELEQMKAMLADLGEPTEGGGGHEDHSSAHGGMMTEADMAALRAATGDEAARLYLQGMIAHHRGAIEASEAQIADGTYGPAVELARKIAVDQAAEISTMERLLDDL